jgi:glycosyltransferase involved in cell wall biosynthesis
MKVYYIGGGYESCYYVRCLLPLVANGYDGDKTSIRGKRVSPEKMMQGAIDADVIVYHRPMDSKMLESAKLLKLAGKKIVMDNDDTYSKDSGVPLNMFKGLKDSLGTIVASIDKKLKEFAELADLVTVTTEVLAEEYRAYNKNVVVLKNCVDPDDWDEPQRNDDGKIRIGIVGSVASNQDYKSIIPLLDILKDRKDVQLVLFALPQKSKETERAVELYRPEFDFWKQYNPEWHSFVAHPDYNSKLNDLKLDIMLIPRFDSYFNRAKSNLKFLEASMCEIPVIAQSFSDGLSPYEVNESDRQYMLLASSTDDWIEKTLSLIDNKEKRLEMGKMAHQYVLKEYNIHSNAHLWDNEYRKLCEQ